MAYTFLDNSLNTIGVLTNKGGQTNDYWGDSITHEIATSQDVLTSVSLSVDKPSVNIDTSGNQKTWNHVIQGLSFNIDGIGRKVNENDYLIYQEGTNGKYYLMAITQVDESAVQSGFHYKTVQGLNAAAYDLSRKTLRAKSFAQIPDNTQEKGTAQNILRYIFKDINWDVRIIGSFGAIDYEITEGTTAQAVLLDIIGMFEAEVDAYVQLNNWGKGANVFNKNGSVKRIFDFSTSLGKYRGETIRYDKNMVSITKTGARDSMYTKLYVNGNNITIADVNHGADFIVDDVANRKYNKLGSVSTPVTYLEGIITNSAIESPTALLAWGKKQLKILNHPRYNYQISAINDDKVQLGDTVIIQDTHASDPIYLKSKVISKTVSLADPVNNSFIVGEFSPIVIGADNGLDDTDQIMQLVNQANQTAVNAQKQADENTKKIADTRTDLEKNIDDRISEAKSYSDELTQTVAKQVNSELAIVKSESDNLSAKTDQMIADANSYADTMYSNAVSFARTEASKALSDANTALDEAKSDLTNGIASEASERQQAVQTVNSQAQDYANQAKSDAIEAAKTADGVVRKDFKETTDALSSTISQNKEDADGKISTAQTTATQALNGLSTKVSQTDYDKKTGDLSTAVNTVTQTANETKNELADISKTVGSQSSKINTISNTVDGTTQAISDIQTEQGKQSGSIATLQSRADGFDASVSKINTTVNSLGQINQLFNTEFSPDFAGWSAGGTDPTNRKPVTTEFTPIGTDGFGSNVVSHKGVGDWIHSAPISVTEGMALSFSSRISVPKTVTAGTPIALYIMAYDIKNARVLSQGYNIPVNQLTATPTTFKYENIIMPSGAVKAYASYGWNVSDEVYISQPMLVFSNHVGAYVQGSYNNNGAIAKAQLTADNAALAINNYKTDADGRIKKAQADIEVNANAITQKVSQSDYDKKTGDLSTKVNTAQSTADTATQTIGTYKETNDRRVSSAETKIKANSDAIKLTVSKTDYDNNNSQLDTRFTNVETTANGASTTVGELKNTVNDLGQINLINNSDFSPDLGGWTTRGEGNYTTGDYDYAGGVYVLENTSSNGFARTNSTPIPIQGLSPVSFSLNFYIFFLPNGGSVYNQLTYLDANYNEINGSGYPGLIDLASGNVTGKWIKRTVNNISFTPPENAKYIVFSFDVRGNGTRAGFNRPILVKGSSVGGYIRGQYNNNTKIASQQITIDGLTNIVSNPTTGLSTRVQTAEGTLSKVTGADIPELQKATFWQPYSSLNFNDYTKQGSFFFNTTSAKTNGPTDRLSWIYLMVDQGTSDNGRIKQTAWYDGVDGVKITYVRTLNSGTWSPWYANDNDSVTTISQTNDSIKREIEDRKTGDNNTLQSSKNFTTSSITNYDQGIQSQFTQTASGILAQVESTNMVVNSEFDPLNGTWYRLSNGGATGSQLAEAWNAPKTTGFADWSAVNGSRVISYAVGTWYSSALVIAGGGNTFSASIVAGRSPAPTVSTALDLRIGFWDSSRKLLTTASAGNIIDGTSYKGAQKYVVENKTAPANTAFVSVIIAHSSANATDYITRPSLNIGDKASPYTPTYGTSSSSTVLSLFKDNWSIGINDHTGDIISGINGDSSGLSIVGKKIIVSGDTTFLGNNFMDGAVIKNASISSAKIDSLDVDKLTGNTAQFVSTKWDSQHSNVTINGDGFHITTNGVDTTLDNTGVHLNDNKNSTSSRYDFSNWYDSSGHTTSAFGLNLGVKNSGNGFLNFIGTSGASFMMYAGGGMNYGTNNNIEKGALNIFAKTIVNGALFFSPNDGDKSIQINGNNGSFNFRTGGSRVANGNYFWFNHNVSVAGTVSGASQLSKKNVKKDYDEDALSEISKTRLVEFEYKNNVGETHISPIIDDINPDKQFYIPETIVNPTREFVDLYSMISMSWKAIQQINEKMEKNNDIKE